MKIKLVALIGCVALGALFAAAGADAAVTASQITTPTATTYAIDDGTGLEIPVTGTTSGEGNVDLRCYREPTGDSDPVLAATATAGAFTSNYIPSEEPRTCRLRAVPAGTEPTDPTPFTGPLLAIGESELFGLETDSDNEGIPFGFYLNDQQETAADDYRSINDCGLYDGYLNYNDFEENETFFCNDFYEQEVAGGPGISGFRVDDENAYFSGAAQSLEEEAVGFPELEYGYTQDPTNGNVVVHDGEDAVECNEASCEEFLPTGVRDERTIEQTEDGHMVTITDEFVSTDGAQHEVQALPQNQDYFGGHGEELEYRFPGGEYEPATLGRAVAFDDTEPGVVDLRVAGAADGDQTTGRGAIVFFQQSSPAVFNKLESEESAFYFDNDITVPAGGSTTVKYVYVQAFEQAEVDNLVSRALGTPEPTEPEAPIITPTETTTTTQGSSSNGSGNSTDTSTAQSAKYKFGIKKIIHEKHSGIAKLRIRFNGPGLIQISGKNIEATQRRTKAGTSYLPVKPTAALAATLKQRGRVHVTVSVQFTPDAGVGRIKDKKVGVWLYA